ncbi:unnamed protein product [Cuscuta campestris]|uniref:SWIM-type domain-containing protein n=1 Tax=Cuscuta campestris TaxID=132261 RepID=A0A484LAG2_9ASTE|nr:unnamed protein product [Cuscuta campestris]
MDSGDNVASSSRTADREPPHGRPGKYIAPTQPLADRMLRALRHPLRLLHRSGAFFFVLGATGNVYTVHLAAAGKSCDCPDRTAPCKHILFVMIRVLGLGQHDPWIWRKTLRRSHLNSLLGSPTSADVLATAEVREKFHQLFSCEKPAEKRDAIEIRDGAACPVCLEEIRREEAAAAEKRIAACGTCKNPIHTECLQAWKKSSSRPRRSAVTCGICRARWRDPMAVEQEPYLNLSAYVSGDRTLAAGGESRGCGD